VDAGRGPRGGRRRRLEGHRSPERRPHPDRDAVPEPILHARFRFRFRFRFRLRFRHREAGHRDRADRGECTAAAAARKRIERDSRITLRGAHARAALVAPAAGDVDSAPRLGLRVRSTDRSGSALGQATAGRR